MTAATRLAAFYATDSKILRRKVIPDSDAELTALSAPPGESMMLMPLCERHDDEACRAAIARATGTPAANGRCCIVDGAGNVIGLCNADPALDRHPQGQLVASERAAVGDRHCAGIFCGDMQSLAAILGASPRLRGFQ